MKVEKGFVDFVTISSNILFSSRYVDSFEELSKEAFYNNAKKQDYNADGYLVGVERVQVDYKALFERYKDAENLVLLLDPPYLSADTKNYKNMDY